MFKYGDKVRVTSGFYEGMEGKLNYPSQYNNGTDDNYYGVEMDDSLLGILTFSVKDLLIK